MSLYSKHIQKSFRAGDGGHDSLKDARAALELAQLTLKKPATVAEVEHIVPELFKRMQKGKNPSKSTFFAPSFYITFAGLDPNVRTVAEESDGSCVRDLVDLLRDDSDESKAVIAVFNDLFEHYSGPEDAAAVGAILDRYNAYVGEIAESLPLNSVLLVYTGNGSTARFAPTNNKLGPGCDAAVRPEFERCRNGVLWGHVGTSSSSHSPFAGGSGEKAEEEDDETIAGIDNPID